MVRDYGNKKCRSRWYVTISGAIHNVFYNDGFKGQAMRRN